MEKSGFEPVFTTFNKGIMALIKSLLDAEEISYYIDNENAAISSMGAVGGAMTVMVAKDQVEEAKEILKEVDDK